MDRSRPECSPWARLGLEVVLGAGDHSVEWFGQGPHHSYPDTGQGARQGWHGLPLEEMDVDYVRPQESGARRGPDRHVLSSTPAVSPSPGSPTP